MSGTIKKENFFEEETTSNEENKMSNSDEKNITKEVNNEEQRQGVNNEERASEETPEEERTADEKIIAIAENMIQEASQMLTPENVSERLEELQTAIRNNLNNIHWYYLGLMEWISKYEELKKEFTDEQIADVSYKMLSLIMENTAYADYNYGILKQITLSNVDMPLLEIKEKINNGISILYNVMTNYFQIEKPQESYREYYMELFQGNNNSEES